MAASPEQMHVVVAGCGPAGLLAATALADEGLDVTIVDPAPDAPWPNRYAVWVDEVAGLGLDAALTPRWPGVRVIFADDRVHTVERAYACVDPDLLRGLLLERAATLGVTVRQGWVAAVGHDPTGTDVDLSSSPPRGRSRSERTVGSQRLRCRVFIDATGVGGPWLERDGQATAYQTAYGIEVDVDSDGAGDGEGRGFSAGSSAAGDDRALPVLMDWRDPLPLRADDAPSFLYALPRPGGRWFLEETVLVREPEVPVDVLAARLAARLEARGVQVRATHHVERCRIPMNVPVPNRRQRCVAFGAAAGFAHPATGYQLSRAAQLAPILARAVADAIGRGAAPHRVSREAWLAIWPANALRRRKALQFGADVLAELDPDTTRAFFGAFFGAPPERVAHYLSRNAGLGAIAATMLSTFVHAPPSLKGHLMRRFTFGVPRDPKAHGAAAVEPQP